MIFSSHIILNVILKYFLSEGIIYNGATTLICVTGDAGIPVLSEICSVKWVYYILRKGGRARWTQKLQRHHGFAVLKDLYHVPGEAMFAFPSVWSYPQDWCSISIY